MLARPLACLTLLALPAIAADTLPSNYRQSLQAERAARDKAMTTPDSWLTMVALERLNNNTVSVGSAPGNTVHLEHGPAHAFTLHTTGSVTTFTAADPSVTFGGKPVHPGDILSVRPNNDEGDSKELHWGKLVGYKIDRTVPGDSNRFYLRLSDPDSASIRSFHGLNFFPVDPSWRIHARWVPYTTPHIIRYGTAIGTTVEDPAAGYAEFTRDGQTIRIQGFQSGVDNVLVNFRDGTSATTTYGAGRVFVAPAPSNGLKAPGDIILDFNEASNWPCAYTPYGTCPLPPKENRFTLPIPAGEKRYHD